ncbi:MAG: ComEA family DNA-binding protein [Pseudomonadota bacterium]
MKKLFGSLLLGVFMSLPAWAAVDLNTATQSELESVRGIGPAKAQAIVAHREKNGPFKSLDDLASVKGFGEASVAKVKDQLSVGAAKAKP